MSDYDPDDEESGIKKVWVRDDVGEWVLVEL